MAARNLCHLQGCLKNCCENINLLLTAKNEIGEKKDERQNCLNRLLNKP